MIYLKSGVYKRLSLEAEPRELLGLGSGVNKSVNPGVGITRGNIMKIVRGV